MDRAFTAAIETTMPCTPEAAQALAQVVEFVNSQEYAKFSRIIFDTAPTGHTLRLRLGAAGAALRGLFGAGEKQDEAVQQLENLRVCCRITGFSPCIDGPPPCDCAKPVSEPVQLSAASSPANMECSASSLASMECSACRFSNLSQRSTGPGQCQTPAASAQQPHSAVVLPASAHALHTLTQGSCS